LKNEIHTYQEEKTMKTKQHNLSAIAMGIALATASLSVSAADPSVASPVASGLRTALVAESSSTPPSFNRAEQTGLCLMESVVSLLASRTNDFNCGNKTYDLSVFTTDNEGVGQAEIGGGVDTGGTTLNAVLGPTVSIGTRCKVDEATGLNLLDKVAVVNYDGNHGWNRTNEIFNSDAYITLRDPQTKSPNYYREVDIKDYFKRVVSGRSWEFDWGLEDIKKFRGKVDSVQPLATSSSGFYYPVQKWHELSWYKHENGQEGELYVRKYLAIPRSARGCQINIAIPDGSLFNGSGEFEANGTVTVGKFTGQAFGNP
jgi:hypothetical protein